MIEQKRAQINVQLWHVPDIVPCIRHSQASTKFCGAQACHFQQGHHDRKEQDGQANESTSFLQGFCTKFAYRKVRWVHVDLQQILSDDTLIKPMTVYVHNDVSLSKCVKIDTSPHFTARTRNPSRFCERC